MNIEQELVRSGFKKESKSKYVKEVNDKFLVVVEGDSELRMLYLIKKPNTYIRIADVRGNDDKACNWILGKIKSFEEDAMKKASKAKKIISDLKSELPSR